MANGDKDASDAASLGPGGAAADSSALEGTVVDDLALSLDMFEIMVPLVDDQVACPVCLKREIHLFFLSLSDLGRHLEQHHVTARIQWRCKDCGKGFPKLHGARCHLPHCKGPSQRPEGTYKCETCPMSFGTQRGLSAHERHAHPAVRNVKRRGTDPPDKNWTLEELALLRELCERYKDHKYPNKMINEVLTNKTIDQIRYQRRKLRLLGEEMSSQEATQATEGGCDPVDPGNACFEEPGINGNNYEQWKLQLELAIATQIEVPPVLRWVHTRLMNIWVTLKGDRESLESAINEFIKVTLYGAIECIAKKESRASNRNKNTSKRIGHQGKKNKKNRNARKRYSYARCQELFEENPRRLADAVVNDDQAFLQPARDPPEAAEVRRLYEDLWGQTGPVEAPIPGNRASELSLCEVFPPIAVEDVAEKINKIRMKAAAGPDGFQKEHLLIPGLPTILAKLFNILCYCSYFPSVWKENRTTLIPKANKPSSLVENWRPITIGPILGRIFSSIIDGRIRRGIVLNPRQKGFTAESGCKINIDLLSAALDYSKKKKGGVFTIVDISKAFDTVPHSAIIPCLARKGVPTPITELISNMYKEGKTIIRTRDNMGVEITILRGVKQGDPLSPLLFNLCLEPLLELIEQQTSGISINEIRKIPVLAFADDVVLLGADVREAQRQVDMLSEYLSGFGMNISRDKSQVFQIVPKRDTWFIEKPKIRLGENTIPTVDPDEAFRYLGAKMGPWKGVHCGIIVPELLSVVRRVRKLSLKPGQKLELILKYIFPRYIYHLLVSPPSDCVLRLLDSEVRQEIKAILHLVPSTATGFFYAPKSWGGLGLPRFEHIIKLGTLKSAIKMKSSIDPAVSSLIDNKCELKLKKMANSLRINWPASLEDIERARKRLKAGHVKQWAELRSQGQGVSDFSRNKTGNVWLEDYKLLKPSRFIDALKLRTNTFGTRSVLARADKNMDVNCRKCRAQPETLGHILGLCQYTRGLRIKRHDEAKLTLADSLRKRNEVFVEPTLRVGGSLFKPDLVVKNEERVLVVDVTVRYENKDYLSRAEKEKVNKYQTSLEHLKAKFNVGRGEVIPVVLGSRGAITPTTEMNLKRMGISDQTIKTLVLNALRSSIELCNIFLDD